MCVYALPCLLCCCCCCGASTPPPPPLVNVFAITLYYFNRNKLKQSSLSVFYKSRSKWENVGDRMNCDVCDMYWWENSGAKVSITNVVVSEKLWLPPRRGFDMQQRNNCNKETRRVETISLRKRTIASINNVVNRTTDQKPSTDSLSHRVLFKSSQSVPQDTKHKVNETKT